MERSTAMKEKNLDTIIKRYLNLFEKRGLGSSKLKLIEEKLNIVLPEDFKRITDVFDGYEEIGGFSLFSFDLEVKEWNVIEKTEFYRASNCKLPRCYLALMEESESFIVMKTQDRPNLPAPVIWCSLSDAYNLQDNTALEANPTIFPSFMNFFEYLLDQEDEERKVGNDH